MKEFLIPTFIYIVIPFISIIHFIFTLKKYSPTTHKEMFFLKLGLTYFTIGGLLLVILTTLLWKSSGLAVIGLIYLVFLAPIIMILIGYDSNKKKDEYGEAILLKASIFYLIALPVFLIFTFTLAN